MVTTVVAPNPVVGSRWLKGLTSHRLVALGPLTMRAFLGVVIDDTNLSFLVEIHVPVPGEFRLPSMLNMCPATGAPAWLLDDMWSPSTKLRVARVPLRWKSVPFLPFVAVTRCCCVFCGGGRRSCLLLLLWRQSSVSRDGAGLNWMNRQSQGTTLRVPPPPPARPPPPHQACSLALTGWSCAVNGILGLSPHCSHGEERFSECLV